MSDFKGTWKIGDVVIPPPPDDGYTYSVQVLSGAKGTERSQITGELTVNHLAVKRQCDFSYAVLNAAKAKAILQELGVEDAVERKFITCTVLTPLGNYYTGEFYCSGYTINLGPNFNGPLWKNLSFTITEK